MSSKTPGSQLPDHSAYRLAYEDSAFLGKDDLRPVRLQLEFLKPEWYLRAANVRSTVVVFGSARLLPPDEAQRRFEAARRQSGEQPDDPVVQHALAQARHKLHYARYYEEARRFGEMVSARFQTAKRRDFVVVTGGGPGIMEAANRGAHDVGARSVGLNVQLPHEQTPNDYMSPELCFRFHYFALRKMHFLLRARALLAFPGGYGTLDELFEVLTLIQTGKIKPMPVVLVGEEYWRRLVDFEFLAEQGMISAADIRLFRLVDTADDAIGILEEFYGKRASR